MIGKTVSNYKILEKLVGGGMGVVYKAKDLKLNRFVALKFLLPDLTRDDEAKERFVHEAKAASALQHNNICTIHEIDKTDDGQIFICMDCYEGETMKEKIKRGPLKIRKWASDILWVMFLAMLTNLSNVRAQDIVINEFLASNGDVIDDEDGDSSDWIELLNTGFDSIDLCGYTITDKVNEPGKWEFPSVIIDPGVHLLVWASGKDRKDPSSLHTNFKLSASGEYIGLYDPEGVVIDTLSFGSQQANISYGRWPDGSGDFVYFHDPTPGNTNHQEVTLSFSPPEGIYHDNITISLEVDIQGGVIRYTLDGSEPAAKSTGYTEPIEFNSNKVLRACVFINDSAMTEIETRTYIVNDDPQLPVLSIATSPNNLWDYKIGIYVNFENHGQDWERPCYITMIENGATKFSLPAGIRIHGDWSRHWDKKNFRIYFRSEYGENILNYRLFPQKTISHFKRLVLYAPACDHPTGRIVYTLIADALTHSLWHEEGGLISAFKPVSLYLNGEYWGIYWIRERIDRYYIESNCGVTNFDLLRNEGKQVPSVREGDTEFWNETVQFFETHNLQNHEDYQWVKENYIHIDNFTDYHIINIFGANWDWLNENLDKFHDRSGDDPRWRWILWDTDAAWLWEYDLNILEYATLERDPEKPWRFVWYTMILRKLLENENYRAHFINRFADLMNTLLSTNSIKSHIDQLADMIRSEIPREENRWRPEDLPYWAKWERNINKIYKFAQKRPKCQRQHIVDKFDLSGTVKVTIESTIGEGSVTLNTITPGFLPWEGIYFQNVPITLKATAASGYTFYMWSDTTLPAESEISVTLRGDYSIHAVFREALRIEDVKIEMITDSSAVVTWTTSMPAISCVEYGPDTTYGFKTEVTMDPATWHSVELNTLIPNTTYYLRVWNWDSYGDSLISEVTIFRTLEPFPAFPEISNVVIDSIGMNSALVIWDTDEPTTAAVEFGIDTTYGEIEYDSTFQSNHQVWLTGLIDTTVYHFHVRSTNAYQLESISQNHTFTTLADHQPSVISEITVLEVTFSSAVITWQTNEETIGWIEYGLTEDVSQTTDFGLEASYTHRDTLNTLYSDTTYYFIVRSIDNAANISISDMQSFRTSKMPTGIVDLDFGSYGIPERFVLSQNYPNPFNSETRLQLQLPFAGQLEVTIYNISGREVVMLYANTISAGYKILRWIGKDVLGQDVSSGIYLLRVEYQTESGEIETATRRLILNR